MIVDLKQFITKLKTNHDLTVGCIVDTNVMFAADYSLDSFNEWAEEVIRELNANGIPIYTNINVRSEFIDLHRRVLIPEGLIDFYKDWSDELDGEIVQKLKSLKTRINE